MLRLVVFDDAKGCLSPLTDLRPVFEVRTGALTTLERLRLTLGVRPLALRVPDAICELTRRRSSDPVNTPLSGKDPVLLVNGRCVLPPQGLGSLPPGASIIERATADVIAACLPADDAEAFLRGSPLRASPASELDAPSLLDRPWHVRTFRDAAIRADLNLLGASPTSRDPDIAPPSGALFESPPEQARPTLQAPPQALVIGGHAVTLRPGARAYPGAILDAESGPIILDEHAVVRPGAVVIGPAYIGPHSTVLERATIRANTAIGPWCKVNGEVGGVIFQGYANKAHDGYLGDSWVGEWVNLGAGTTGSNLLNTYSEIIARACPETRHEHTGETFLGSIIGDHVKTAICTRLMTGSVIHTGCMIATTAPASGCIPRFTWATDRGSQLYRLDKFTDVMRAAMTRRKVDPSAPYLARLEQLHAAARSAPRTQRDAE